VDPLPVSYPVFWYGTQQNVTIPSFQSCTLTNRKRNAENSFIGWVLACVCTGWWTVMIHRPNNFLPYLRKFHMHSYIIYPNHESVPSARESNELKSLTIIWKIRITQLKSPREDRERDGLPSVRERKRSDRDHWRNKFSCEHVKKKVFSWKMSARAWEREHSACQGSRDELYARVRNIFCFAKYSRDVDPHKYVHASRIPIKACTHTPTLWASSRNWFMNLI
jgi:hypothetical protein